MNKKHIFFGLILSTVVGIIYNAFSNANGVASQTTAPDETTCSQQGCHGSGNGEGSSGGLADNTGGGSITISGITGNYVPGTTYNLTVRVNQLGGNLFGFSFEALDNSAGTAGTLTATLAGTRVATGTSGTRSAITQGHNGATGTIAGIGSDYYDFTFTWQAPANSVGPITLYAAGIAANQDALQGAGDNVYSTSLTLTPSVAVSSPLILLSRSTIANPAFCALANSVGNTVQFDVAGLALTGNLSVSLSGANASAFALSKSANGPFTNSLSITSNGGNVSNTPVYIQYTGPASGTSTATVNVSGGGASTKSITLNGSILSPTLAAPSVSTINFGSVGIGSGESADQSFTISHGNLFSGMTITCPAGYEATLVPGRDYFGISAPIFGNFQFTFSSTIFVRLKNPTVAGSLNGNLTITAPGASTQTIALTANVSTPTSYVLASSNYLSLFNTSAMAASSVQSFNVTGSGLTANAVITPPVPFEVSLSSSSGFGTSVSIAPTAGSISSTPVYVRYNPSAPALDNGYLTVSSTGATDQLIKLVGTSTAALATPTISSVGTLTTFSTVTGTPSSNQSFTLSGSNLSGNITVTAPSNFEVSLSSSSGYGASISLTAVSGNVSNTTVYARYNPSASGTHNGNITATSTNATTQNIAVSGTANTPTGIKENENNLLLNVFPNPSNGQFTVEVDNILKATQLRIIDVNGKQVYSETVQTSKKQVDISKQSEGIYYLMMERGNEIIQRKVILNK